jgi:glycosyltransferase involved in cell wall biosynthesis
LVSKKILIMAPAFYTIVQSNLENIKILKSMNCEVHIISNIVFGSSMSEEKINNHIKSLQNEGIIIHHIPFTRRSIIQNIKALQKYRTILAKEKYDVIHCHTETGGILTRLAKPKKLNAITQIIYTPHGFEFYRGAPFKNWLIYYPIERWIVSNFDVMISINKEDFSLAKKMNVKHNKYIPGVGININRFSHAKVNKLNKRNEFKIGHDTTVLVSVGELYPWKNHESVIYALEKLKYKDIVYLVCGIGKLENYLHKLTVKLNVEDRVIFAGYRTDIPEILKIADIFVFPSLHEGLPLSIMEAMASGLPCIVSNVRGNIDLIEDGKGGRIVEPRDIEGYVDAIDFLISTPNLREKMGVYNRKDSCKYSVEEVNNLMACIYKDALKE